MFDLLKYSGYIAAVCGAITLMPEIARALKTHRLQDISWAWLIMMSCNSVLWFSYGTLLHDVSLMFSPLINVFMEITLMILKKHYNQHRHPVMHAHLPHCEEKVIGNVTAA